MQPRARSPTCCAAHAATTGLGPADRRRRPRPRSRFDVSVCELCAAARGGRARCIARRRRRSDAAARCRATGCGATAVHASLPPTPLPSCCSTRRWPAPAAAAPLLTGGEAAAATLAGALAGRAALELLQRLRPHRGHDLVDDLARLSAAGDGARRRSAAPIADTRRLRARPRPAAGARRRAGRALHRRRRAGARLPRPAGADGRALRARPVRRRAGRAPLPHRRPRRAACRTASSSSWAASTTR